MSAEASILQRTSLRQQVSDRARAAIVAGRMHPGQIYSVPSLAAEYGVSFTPVREAMLDLVKDGLLEPVPNRGFRVATLSEKDLDEVFWLRETLEVGCLPEVMAALDSRMVKRLYALVGQVEKAAERQDAVDYLAADRTFHLTLIGLTGNRRLVDYVGSLRSQSRLYTKSNRFDTPNEVAEHRRLVDLLHAGDLAGAEDLLRSHLRRTRSELA